MLARHVRERQVRDLSNAITKMTLLPARILELEDRGRLAVGCAADLIVFDPATIADQAAFVEPTLRPHGIRLVFVNGQLALSENRVTVVPAGLVLRRAP